MHAVQGLYCGPPASPAGFMQHATLSDREFPPKHGSDYKKNGLKMEVVMIPDKCGREKTVGLRFLNKDGYNAPPV